MRIRLAILAQLVFALLAVPANATFDWEKAAPDQMGAYEDSVVTFTSGGPGGKAMFVFVVFPGQEPIGEYPVSVEADSISIGLTDYLRNQSGGVHDYDPIVIVNPNHANGWWVADFPAETYNDSTTVPRRYFSSWYGDINFRHLGELQAETLLKINAA
jgi:hypothetical protein